MLDLFKHPLSAVLRVPSTAPLPEAWSAKSTSARSDWLELVKLGHALRAAAVYQTPVLDDLVPSDAEVVISFRSPWPSMHEGAFLRAFQILASPTLAPSPSERNP